MYDADVAYSIAIRRAVRVGNDRWLAENPEHGRMARELAIRAENGNSFYNSVLSNYREWGKLSPKQMEVLRTSFARDDERRAEWAAKNREANAGSNWVGEVGKRQVFELTCVAVKKMTDNRYTSINNEYTFTLLKDKEDNIFVYFGKFLCEKGREILVKATIKRHQERDGVKQTAISRPTLQ